MPLPADSNASTFGDGDAFKADAFDLSRVWKRAFENIQNVNMNENECVNEQSENPTGARTACR